MMDITISRNGESAASYFSSSLSKEGNYYQEDVPAYWEGETAKHPELDLYGKEVTNKDFHDLVHNINPKTKKRLTPINVKNRKAGYDITTSAVKSVSILHALTKDSELFEAHKYANRMMMQAIEKDAQAQANTQYGRFYETTSNMIWASFHHFTSRPVETEVDGKTAHISDMQLHSHNYTISATRSLSRDKFLALETGNIFRVANFYQSVYHAYFSKRLNDLGYVIERNKNAYEIIGVSRSMIEWFSSRRMEILKLAKEKDITNPKALANLSLVTRNSKGKSVGKDELYKFWKARLSKTEFEGLFEIKGKYAPKSNPIPAREAVQRSLDHFLERNSTVQAKKVLGYALQLGYGELLPEDVERAMAERQDIVRSEEHTISIITTRDTVRAENKMIAMAVEGKGKLKPLKKNYKPRREFLNLGQLDAVKTALYSSDFVTGIQGNAGTGKTTLLQELSDGVASVKKPMLAIAPSSAAVDVLRKEGFDAHTVAAYLINPKLQENVKGGVLLFDEAGLSGVKSMTRVLEAAKEHNARVILSGDIHQLSSPGEAGDAFRLLQKDAKINTAHVRQNMRQKPEQYKKAVDQIARGRILEGYQSLDKMNAVKEIPERKERLEVITNDYVASIKLNRNALVVSPTNMESDQITRQVRKKLKEIGKIKGKERTYPILKNLSLTKSEKKDVSSYEKGQVVRFIRNQKGGFKAGSHYQVISNDGKGRVEVEHLKSKQVLTLPLEQTEHFSVYRESQIELSKGDLIRPTENLKSKENTKINNGTPQRIKGFVGKDIKLENGRTLKGDSFHIKHAYVDTVHASQGKTAQDVFISMSDQSFAGVNEKAFYVGVSRAKQSIKLYTSDKKELKKAISKSAYQLSAREVAKDHERRLLEKKQRSYEQDLSKKQHHEKSRQRTTEAQRHISRNIER